MSKLSEYEFDGEFDEVLEIAMARAWNPRQMQFLESLMERFEEYGEEMFLSQNQYDWLMSILG